MTHLHLQIALANTQWARPGQMWPSWPKRVAARLSWRRATTTDYVERKLNVWIKKITVIWLLWANAGRSSLSYSNREEKLKSSRCSRLGQMSECDWTAAPTLNQEALSFRPIKDEKFWRTTNSANGWRLRVRLLPAHRYWLTIERM